MGVYSNLAVQKINEQEMLENFQFSDLLEFAIDIQKSDQAMFDAMLEMDFHEAYESKGIITLTEADKENAVKVAVKNIWGKIVEVLKRFLGMIKTFIAKISNKFAELSGKNKQLVERIKVPIKSVIIEKIKGKDIQVTALNVAVDVVKNKIDAFLKVYEKADGGSDIAGEVKTLLSGLDATDQYFTKIDLEKYLDQDKFEMADLRDRVADPKKELNDALSEVETLQQMVSDDITEYEKKAKNEKSSDDDRAEANRIARNLNVVLDGCTKLLSFITSFYARKAACERAIYTKIGAIDGAKLTAGDKVEQVKNVSKAAADAAKNKAKDVAHDVKHGIDNAKAIAKNAKDLAKDQKAQKQADKTATGESALEDLEYQFMSIDVVNEAYIEELFA
jgi:hypothetical protein